MVTWNYIYWWTGESVWKKQNVTEEEKVKILLFLGYSLLSFKFIPYIEKQHSYGRGPDKLKPLLLR